MKGEAKNMNIQSTTLMSGQAQAKTWGRFLIPTVLVFVFFILEVVFSYNDTLSILGYPIYIAVPITALAFLVMGIANVVRKKYFNGLSLLVTIPVFIFAFGFPPVYLINAVFVSSYLNLSWNEDQYLSGIEHAESDGRGHKYLEFKHDSLSPMIVYDSSDDIALHQSNKAGVFWTKWGKSSDQGRSCVAIIRKLKTHFYLVITNSEVC